jgi:hypothetical protein
MRKLLTLVAVLLLATPHHFAEASDAVLAGEWRALYDTTARERSARLVITTPYFGRAAVTLRVKSIQQLQNGALQHLFQGKIRFRGVDRSGGARWYPLAASTIVGVGVTPHLEFITPLAGVRRSAKQRGLVQVKFPWGSRTLLGSLTGKSAAATGYRLTRQGSCPVNEVAPIPSILPAHDVGSSAARVVNISVQSDAEYAALHGGAAEAKIRATFNAVDTLYQAQLGTQVHVPTVRIFNSATQPTVSNNAFDLLGQFADSNNSTRLLGDADGYMLATGKRITDGVIGLAAFRRICRGPSSAYGLWESLSDLIDVVIVAHELGHMCGAPHEDRAGVNIMQSQLGAAIPQRFAGSSIQLVNTHFGQYYPGCFGRTLAEAQPTATPSASPTNGPGRPSPTATPGPGGTASPTPRPGVTPTVPGGGGPGGGSGGGGPRLPPMTLRATVQKDGNFLIAAETDDSFGLSCELTLSAGTTSGLARSQELTIFTGSFPVTLQLGFSAKVAGSLQAKGKAPGVPGRAFLYSRLVCDGAAVAESEPIPLNTGAIRVVRGKGKKAKRVVFGGSRWFALLKSSLKQAAVTGG